MRYQILASALALVAMSGLFIDAARAADPPPEVDLIVTIETRAPDDGDPRNGTPKATLRRFTVNAAQSWSPFKCQVYHSTYENAWAACGQPGSDSDDCSLACNAYNAWSSHCPMGDHTGNPFVCDGQGGGGTNSPR